MPCRIAQVQLLSHLNQKVQVLENPAIVQVLNYQCLPKRKWSMTKGAQSNITEQVSLSKIGTSHKWWICNSKQYWSNRVKKMTPLALQKPNFSSVTINNYASSLAPSQKYERSMLHLSGCSIFGTSNKRSTTFTIYSEASQKPSSALDGKVLPVHLQHYWTSGTVV